MNKRGLYAIRDNKAEHILNDMVMVFPNEIAAIRFYSDVAAQKDSAIHKHIADYDLIYIGDLSADETGIASAGVCDTSAEIMKGKDYLDAITKENNT